MFGAVNALFSGLAFAGLIIAILLQRQELQLQREELAETRKEIRRSAEAQEQLVRAQQQAALMNARATLSGRYIDPRSSEWNQDEGERQFKLLIESVEDLEREESE